MKIIPVIDVMGGKVVHAKAGNRSEYAPLTSCLTPSSDIATVIAALLELHDFSLFYIADLDAIMNGSFDSQRYQDVCEAFPHITFYLDAGIKHKADWFKIKQYEQIIPVIGSETLVDISWIKEKAVAEYSLLSLDFKQGQFLGNESLLSPEYWPSRVIAMNLDSVGSQRGPDIALLQQLQTQSSKLVIASGGVRNVADLELLRSKGIKQVLVASALHNGQLTKQDLLTISEA